MARIGSDITEKSVSIRALRVRVPILAHLPAARHLAGRLSGRTVTVAGREDDLGRGGRLERIERNGAILAGAVAQARQNGTLPVVLGGDHLRPSTRQVAPGSSVSTASHPSRRYSHRRESGVGSSGQVRQPRRRARRG